MKVMNVLTLEGTVKVLAEDLKLGEAFTGPVVLMDSNNIMTTFRIHADEWDVKKITRILVIWK